MLESQASNGDCFVSFDDQPTPVTERLYIVSTSCPATPPGCARWTADDGRPGQAPQQRKAADGQPDLADQLEATTAIAVSPELDSEKGRPGPAFVALGVKAVTAMAEQPISSRGT